jgi:hypothetical protein
VKPLRVLVTPAEFFALMIAAQVAYDAAAVLLMLLGERMTEWRRKRRPWSG